VVKERMNFMDDSFCKKVIAQFDNVDLNNFRSIGSPNHIVSGFCRTAYAIITNYSLSTYTIIDLHEMLSLSKRFLKMVLPECLFSKIIFCQPGQLNYLGPSDLILNIDSMQEVPYDVARGYLEWISRSAKYFFTKMQWENIIQKK